MTDATEFTEFDQRMIEVFDNLSQLQEELTDYAMWLYEEWITVSDDPMPFFEVHERYLSDGRSVCKFVFLLRELEVDSSDLDGHRR